MQSSIINCEQLKTNNWQGGTTTQLFIYPPKADYANKNFNFRLSTATVNVEKSEFTSLPGVRRKLMILEGQTLLSHQNHHSKQLNKFDIDEFEGDWKTSSCGKCTDFNLMCTGKTKAELSALILDKNKMIHYPIHQSWDWFFVYVYSGKINIMLDLKKHTLKSKSLFVIKQFTKAKLNIEAIKKSELIFTKIK